MELLTAMLRSIDEPIERVVVVDNTTSDRWEGPTLRASQCKIIRPAHNLGVAASWNLIVKSTPLAPWWAIVNCDIEFAPGDLKRLADYMNTTEDPGMGMLQTPAAFGITASAIERAGFWDENFVPAYFDDNDYAWRMHLAGVPITPLHAGYSHVVSAVIKNDDRASKENGRTFPENQLYYQRKWGGNPRHEIFTTPFNAGGDLRAWTLPLERLRELTWRLD